MSQPKTFSRRRLLTLLGLGAAAAAGCSTPLAAMQPPPGGNPSDGAAGGTPADQTGNKSMNDNLPRTPAQAPPGKELATLAAGCFWCVEAVFLDLKGVEKVVSGYSGGFVDKPSYDEVCSGTTGHAEVIQVTFDPKAISFDDLLRVFFTTHDPTTLNRQGADVGTQYRSAVFFHSPEQKAATEKILKEVAAEKLYRNPVVTEVTPFANFYAAEDYHQNYYARNPSQGYCRVVIDPKVRKFREKWSHLLKTQ